MRNWPDRVEVSFKGSKTISEIDVITQQDNHENPVEPTLSQTFSLYGITAFEVQYWTGSAWTTVPGANVTGNNKVWRQFTFAPITTSKIRVVVNAGADNAHSRVVEVEAWEAVPVNYALPANGGTASASSFLGPPYNLFPSFVNDGARTSINGGIWLDNTTKVGLTGPLPAKKGEPRVTRQTRNKAGMGTKFEKHKRGGRHVHDDRHNKKKKPNVHYGIPK